MATSLMTHPPAALVGNRLLASLPRKEYEHILPLLTPVHLPQGRTLWEAGDQVRHAYFIKSGMISVLCTTRDGASIEAGMIGNDGLAGIPAILRINISPYKMMTQLPTNALRIKAEALSNEFNRGGRLHDLLLGYMHMLLTQIAQSVACNSFHLVEQRLCRWLLISRDRAKTDTLQLTQEFLAHMWGVPRTSVTATAGKIQKLGLIRYRRGQIQIIDRQGLEAAACECYEVIKEESERFLAA